MDRREMLIGIGLAGATATLPVAGASLPQAPLPDRRAWNVALARFRAAEAAFDTAWTRLEEAEEAVEAAVPRVDRFFDEYRLGRGMKRDDVEYWLRQFIARTGRKIDVQAEADAFDASEKAQREATARFATDVLHKEAKALRPAFYEARDALMAVPAPDAAALLVKLEVAAVSLDEKHVESAHADARRLLSGGRA